MISFLFWNLNQNTIHKIVANIVLCHSIDVLMLTECSFEPTVLLECLNRDDPTAYHYAPGIGCKKVDVFTRFSSEFIFPLEETDRLTIRHVKLPGVIDILLAIVHFPSSLSENIVLFQPKSKVEGALALDYDQWSTNRRVS